MACARADSLPLGCTAAKPRTQERSVPDQVDRCAWLISSTLQALSLPQSECFKVLSRPKSCRGTPKQQHSRHGLPPDSPQRLASRRVCFWNWTCPKRASPARGPGIATCSSRFCARKLPTARKSPMRLSCAAIMSAKRERPPVHARAHILVGWRRTGAIVYLAGRWRQQRWRCLQGA